MLICETVMVNGPIYNAVKDSTGAVMRPHRLLKAPSAALLRHNSAAARPRSMCDVLYGPLLEYFRKRKSVADIGTRFPSPVTCINGRPRSLPLDLKIDNHDDQSECSSSSSTEELQPALTRRQLSRRGFRGKRRKEGPPAAVKQSEIIDPADDEESESVSSIQDDQSTTNRDQDDSCDTIPSPLDEHCQFHYGDRVSSADEILTSPTIQVDPSYLIGTPFSSSVTSINSDQYAQSLDRFVSSSHLNEKLKPGGTAPPSLRRSYETIMKRKKLAVTTSLPTGTSSLRLKADHNIDFKSLPHFPPVRGAGSASGIDFKSLESESRRGGPIRRSLRSTLGSFKRLAKKHKHVKSVSVTGFVILDRYLSVSTWNTLSELSPADVRKQLPCQNRVLDECPRIVTPNDVVFGTFADTRSLGLFLRPYRPYLSDEQFTVRLNFAERHYKLYHELVSEGAKHTVTSCNVGVIEDVTSLSLECHVTVPMLTVCCHDVCAVSALQHAYCKELFMPHSDSADSHLHLSSGDEDAEEEDHYETIESIEKDGKSKEKSSSLSTQGKKFGLRGKKLKSKTFAFKGLLANISDSAHEASNNFKNKSHLTSNITRTLTSGSSPTPSHYNDLPDLVYVAEFGERTGKPIGPREMPDHWIKI